MANENRRVKMTKALLNDSFLSLLEEKPLPRITVKDICEGADVNRSTYYVYYSDPYDQLRKMEDAFLDDQAVYVDKLLSQPADASFEATLAAMMHCWRDHQRMLRILLGDHGDAMFAQRILLYFGQRILGSAQAQLAQIQTQDYVYHASGGFGLMRYWLMQNCAESPEELAHRITQLTYNSRP